MQTLVGLARLVVLPENQSALAAFCEVARCIQTGEFNRLSNPLFVHGPPGVGKSALVAALADEVIQCGMGQSVCVLSGTDFPLPWEDAGPERLQEAGHCDLLIVEDLQHLPARAVASLINLLDTRLSLDLLTVFTATSGPTQVAHRGSNVPARLTNRLAAGLVVAIQPLHASSRRLFLEESARRRDLTVPDEILCWLSASLSGCRQLENALYQIRALQNQSGSPPSLDDLRQHLALPGTTSQSTLDRIVRQVGSHYRIEPRLLRSSHRHRQLMQPRQVSMYLARKLTPLTLQQIGVWFSDRNHATVLHACRKVTQALEIDPQLMGTLRQIHAELA